MWVYLHVQSYSLHCCNWKNYKPPKCPAINIIGTHKKTNNIMYYNIQKTEIFRDKSDKRWKTYTLENTKYCWDKLKRTQISEGIHHIHEWEGNFVKMPFSPN